MLINFAVIQIVPGGPLDSAAQVGDIVLSVDGQRLSSFTSLDAILDDHVGKAISMYS